MTAKSRRPSARVMVQAEDMSRAEDHEQRIRALEFQTEGSLYQMVVFRPQVPVTVGDDAFIFHIPPELDQAEFLGASMSLFEAGGGDCQVQLRHSAPCEVGSNILSTKLTVEAGDCYDNQSAVIVPGVIVDEGDHIHVDVDQASGIGMDIALVFTPGDLAAVFVEGIQGPPGGVTQWLGAWLTANGYTVGQAVSNGGTTYVSIVNHTSGAASEPGVGADWEDFWMALVETNRFASIQCNIFTDNMVVDQGVKGFAPVPFDCTIVEATLLADAAGDADVDFWVDTYGNHPPTGADSISGGTGLSLGGGIKTTNTSLTGWTTSLSAGDVISFYVMDPIHGLGVINASLRVERL